ncbi:MAG TPA: LysR family transcriptional regulator [Nocardioides sp.]|uniref:LysR family transcriptional regulator n=1 Tax=uncultured Nocardioides sp. TaxID=198441 RepID=UPI000ECB63B0|nr:LysR family transcriptional regulator [uncultured Nocardioides sp.]MDP3968627.1 LysR family transcriptional regulator [Nocardioides sp.]HCB03278.1 LysR family transcriptional regulator [Nocardioides sp.]HRI93975.1 LysR family transcriptional regulator [Nocardioides sp.]HRK43989.1 LysR family transcriptional regulator [Nocardioides sp.]
MQLSHLRYLVATAEEGSVSKAAVRVHVAQPSLSRQLRQLERDLGVPLFERGAGRLVLNRTGRALLPGARAVLAAAEALQDSAAYHRRGRIKRLTIAAPTVTLTDVVSPFVATMSPDDPVVDVLGADGLDPVEMLRAGADLVIGTRRPPAPYAARELATLPVWAYVPNDDPWAARESLTISELVSRPLVALPSTFTAREALDAAVVAYGGSYTAMVEAANGTIAQALAASGRGVAVVSDDPRYDLVPLSIDLGGEMLAIHLTAAWDSSGVAASTIADVAERLRAWVVHVYESATPTTPRLVDCPDA